MLLALRIMGCCGAGELVAITIVTNNAIHPDPRVSLIVTVLLAGSPTTWQLMTLSQGKLSPVLVTPQGKKDLG